MTTIEYLEKIVPNTLSCPYCSTLICFHDPLNAIAVCAGCNKKFRYKKMYKIAKDCELNGEEHDFISNDKVEICTKCEAQRC